MSLKFGIADFLTNLPQSSGSGFSDRSIFSESARTFNTTNPISVTVTPTSAASPALATPTAAVKPIDAVMAALQKGVGNIRDIVPLSGFPVGEVFDAIEKLVMLGYVVRRADNEKDSYELTTEGHKALGA